MLELPDLSRVLLVLRHGKSDWDAGYAQDFDRPLASRGVKAAQRMGAFIASLGIAPELIVSSPARRAISTAELAAAELGIEDIQQEPAIYGAGYERLSRIVSGLPDDVYRAMIVGHNPGLESLVEGLSGESYVMLKTCSLAVLEARGDSWEQFDYPPFRLRALFHPRELPEDS